MKDGKLNGKVAVVTGASKGIGAGIAKELAAEGASVVVNYASARSDGDKVVDEITHTLAKELGTRKIRVNSINPGMVVTEGSIAGGYTEGDMRKMFESQTPLGRVGEPDDIAPAAVFFASDDSKWVTGETLLIAGGLR